MQCTASLIITLSARQLDSAVTLCAPEDYSTAELDEIRQIIRISLQSEKELNNPENFPVLPNSIWKFHRVFSSKNVTSIQLQLANTRSVLHLPSKHAYRARLAQTVRKPCSRPGPSAAVGRCEPRCLIPILLQKTILGSVPSPVTSVTSGAMPYVVPHLLYLQLLYIHIMSQFFPMRHFRGVLC